MTDNPIAPTSNQKLPFQRRVVDWMMETFSMEVCRNTTERNHRFLEEALELVQSLNCTKEEAHMLVDYVFGRPKGDPEQEVGGVMVTLAALCAAADISMAELGDRELARCWLNIDRIRAKQAGKPAHSPLPGATVETTEHEWVIVYADQDLLTEHFSGAGADAAARYRFEQLKMAWTCRLFRCVDKTGYGPAVKATAEHPAAAHYRSLEGCCEDCPPIGYPTDKTRCDECPRSSKNGSTR